MNISLHNFKCWNKQSFSFPDKGLMLISGRSGQGKSSILQSINFALFNKGKKLVSYGKKECRVELNYDDITIVRNKGPNRLVLIKDGVQYEQSEAQKIIDSIFGDAFNVYGYVEQDMFTSFVYLNPIAKLEFLEKVTFKNIDISGKKSILKSSAKERETILNMLSSKVEVNRQFLSDIEPPNRVSFPLKNSNGKPYTEKNRSIAIKNEYIRQKNGLILIRKKRDEIERIEELEYDRKELQTFVASNEQLLLYYRQFLYLFAYLFVFMLF